MSKKRKRSVPVSAKAARAGRAPRDVVWRQSAEEATLAAKPRYNGYACGHGAHGPAKYSRTKAKQAWQRQIRQEGASRGSFLYLLAICFFGPKWPRESERIYETPVQSLMNRRSFICFLFAFCLLERIKCPPRKGESMTDRLATLIDNLRTLTDENEYVEFKKSFTEPVQEGRDISALANSAAYHGARFAYKVWGVDDSAHEVVGTSFKPEREKQGNAALPMWLRQNLSDNANFEFEEGEYKGKPIVVLKIWPAVHHPVEFQKKAFIRKGSHTQSVKSGSLVEHELWNRIQRQDFERQVALEDLEVDEAFQLLNYGEYFDAQDLSRPTTLDAVLHYFEKENLAFRQDDGLVSITNLGALLFAKDMGSFPSVKRKKIRVSRYDGKGRTAPRSEKEFSEGYASALPLLYSYLEGLLETPEVINGTRREKRLLYSEVALRELVTNALIHQDLSLRGAGPLIELFEDRIEITNPGSPLIEVERIVNDPPRSRNEELSALMRRLSYCEESGTGWDKVVEGCEAFHAPAPKIEVQTTGSDSMRVVLFQPRPYKQLTPEERLDACYWHSCIRYANRDYVSNASLRERFGMENSNSAQISRLIKEALAKSLIKPVDPEASQKFMRYQPHWA